ncbi:MAG: hypothetical protein H6739_05540 [Alphaproteobacteria bacterium]|nr:hypothetical protein [Alphaproteobacteria bacterium]
MPCAPADRPLSKPALLGICALIAARVLLDGATLTADPGRFVNWEETWNATEAWFLWHAGLWDQLLALQYKEFCGGCTALAAMGAPVLGLAGDHWLAWKAVGLVWTAATLAVGFVAARRWLGLGAAWCFLALLAAAPRGLAELDLYLWGNHAASALPVLAALALARGRPRPLALGIVAGAALWFCRTSAYGGVVAMGAAALAWSGRGRLTVGFLAGASLMLLPAAAGDVGSYDFTAMGVPEGGLGRKVAALLHPVTLSERLFLAEGWTAGGAMLLLTALAGYLHLLRRPGSRALAAMPALFALAFLATDLPLRDLGPERMATNARYEAPWMLLLLLGAAALLGAGVEARGKHRIGAVIGLLALMGAGVGSRAAALGPPSPRALALRAIDPPRFGAMVIGRVPFDVLAQRESADPEVEGTLRWAAGAQLAVRVVEEALPEPEALARLEALPPMSWWGFGAARRAGAWDLDAVHATNRALAGLDPERARAMGYGFAFDLGHGLRDPKARPLLDALQKSPDALRVDGQPCWLCAALAPATARRCERPSPRETLDCVAAAGRRGGGDATLFGAGFALVRAPRDRVRERTLAEQAGALGLDALVEGITHPAAGLPVALGPGVYRRWDVPWSDAGEPP